MSSRGPGIGTRIIIAVVLLVFLSSVFGLSNFNQFSLSGSGYSTAFEGPKARFSGISYGGKNYYPGQANGASLNTFDTVMHWDADGATSGKPNINGEMTTVFLPEQTLQYFPSWVPVPWIQNNGLVQNPQRTFEWNFSDNMYYMEEYKMKWYVSMNSEWDGNNEDPPAVDPILEPHTENIYNNVGVWIEFDITPTWYIQGAGQAFFAIGKIQLGEDAMYAAKELTGTVYDHRQTVSASPESRQAPLYIYYGAFGGESAEVTSASYQGKDLNPAYFRNKVYARIDLNNFGVANDAKDFLWTITKGDTLTMCFDITVFVIGKWTVQDIQEDPDRFGRFERAINPYNIFDWLKSPQGVVWVTLGLIILGAVLLLFFAPWVLVAILAMMGIKKR